MNRSVFDEETGFQYKNYAAVHFPMLLDLGPWVVGSAVNEASKEVGSDVEQWTMNPRVSMVAGGGRPSRISGPIYELRAVIAHMGRHENGHYVCYRRHPKLSPPAESKRAQGETPPPLKLASGEDTAADSTSLTVEDGDAEDAGSDEGQWWRFSDHQVNKVDEEDVLGQGGVFMLFYDNVESGMALASEYAGVDSLKESDDKTASGASDVTVKTSTFSTSVPRPSSCVLAEAAAVALPDDSDND